MSETAHDLRSPLTAVRESIRLVRDGDLGPVNDDQQGCLESAIDQCGCMEQMVGEMVQLERLRTGMPRVHRQWVSVEQVRRLVDESLRPWAEPRNLNVLWDGADDPSLNVYADPAMLRRLVVNLATNAIRASAEGGFVLIRLARIRHGEAIRWSVVDRGRGISEDEMRNVSDRAVSYAGGEGLGLSISRQLAALQFSSLKMRSRLGKGTEVTFETAAAGPRSVASLWTRWRLSFQSSTDAASSIRPAQSPPRETTAEIRDPKGERHIRLDPPVVAVSLRHEATTPRSDERVAVGVVSLGATVSRAASEQFDKQLQSQLQMFDLVYRTEQRRWVWCLDADDIDQRIDLITDVIHSQIPGIRMTWSDPQMVPLDDRRTGWRLCDLMVREALAASNNMQGFEADDVRPGTPPLSPSAKASTRLDAELARLTSDLRSQTDKLLHQARNLRPKF